MDFDALFAQVLALLQREQRISYRVLKRRFALSDEDLEDLKDELIYGVFPATMTLVANSANSHSSVMVDHDTAASSGNPGQFATSVNHA